MSKIAILCAFGMCTIETGLGSIDYALPYRQLFEQYRNFNAIQSDLLNDLLNSDRSIVLCAPTGSGKTVAFEFAIVRMLLQQNQQHQQHETNDDCEEKQTEKSITSEQTISWKAIYVAPIKALCSERFADWKSRFEPLAVTCVQITGDTDMTDLQAIRHADVVVTTPEKWDSMTRRWRESCDIVRSVRVFIIDEVHLLNEDIRGPILEAIVSRMRTIDSNCGGGIGLVSNLRFIVASAIIPNIEDLTAWIGSGHGTGGASVKQFVYTHRPVPLVKHILGFNSKLKGFQFDLSLNYKLYDIIRKYSDRKATLIFCSCRKSAEMAANVLEKREGKLFELNDEQKSNLMQLAPKLQDVKLQRLLASGIGYHHAGMTYNDRYLIEDAFRKGHIMILLSTNTLAMGVNLPAHLVVIKSTEFYCHGTMTEYPESTLLQMIGRAGRPQFDTRGVAVILTHTKNVGIEYVLLNRR